MKHNEVNLVKEMYSDLDHISEHAYMEDEAVGIEKAIAIVEQYIPRPNHG